MAGNEARDARAAERRAAKARDRATLHERVIGDAKRLLGRKKPDEVHLGQPDVVTSSTDDAPETQGQGVAVPRPSPLPVPEVPEVVPTRFDPETRKPFVLDMAEVKRIETALALEDIRRRVAAEEPQRPAAPAVEQLGERQDLGGGQTAFEVDPKKAINEKALRDVGMAASRQSGILAHHARQHEIQREHDRQVLPLRDELIYIERRLHELTLQAKHEEEETLPWRAPISGTTEFGEYPEASPEERLAGSRRGAKIRQQRVAESLSLKDYKERVLERLRDIGPRPKPNWAVPSDEVLAGYDPREAKHPDDLRPGDVAFTIQG